MNGGVDSRRAHPKTYALLQKKNRIVVQTDKNINKPASARFSVFALCRLVIRRTLSCRFETVCLLIIYFRPLVLLVVFVQCTDKA